jgi:predicted small metal-binding protein
MFRFICKLEGKPCGFKVHGRTREEVESHARAHAERFHSMDKATSMSDLVTESIEEVQDYPD